MSLGHCQRLNLKSEEGRAEAAPHLNVMLKAIFDYDFEHDDDEADEEEELALQVQRYAGQHVAQEMEVHM